MPHTFFPAVMRRAPAPRSVHANHQVLVMVCFTIAMVIDQVFAKIDMIQWPVASALLILMLGVPHGALDVAIAERRHVLDSRRSIAVFLVTYVSLAAAVLAAWWVLPALTLTLFLLLSALHFGGDWHAGKSLMHRAVQGGAMLAATTVLHNDEVAGIFALLAPVDAAHAIAATMHGAAPLLLAAAAAMWLSGRRQNLAETFEFMLVLAGAVLLAPITFFILYFCLLHSVRHFLESWHELAPCTAAEIVRKASPYAAAANIACCAGAFAFAQGTLQATLLPAVFITLAALTVPHMCLVDGSSAKPAGP